MVDAKKWQSKIFKYKFSSLSTTRNSWVVHVNEFLPLLLETIFFIFTYLTLIWVQTYSILKSFDQPSNALIVQFMYLVLVIYNESNTTWPPHYTDLCYSTLKVVNLERFSAFVVTLSHIHTQLRNGEILNSEMVTHILYGQKKASKNPKKAGKHTNKIIIAFTSGNFLNP